MRLSVVMPVLNEAATLEPALRNLQGWRSHGHEVIVVDGGSDDETAAIARREGLADHVLQTERGRARQMNAGAAVAVGDVLVFLHADTQLPPSADQLLTAAWRDGNFVWGRFDVRLSGAHPLLRVVEWMMNWRSRISGIATGDQAIFVRRECFAAIGGYPDIPLMEDIELSTRLKQYSRPLALTARVVTSSRRWEQHGVIRTVVLMWWLRLAYALGADPRHLVQRYYRKSACVIRSAAS